MVIYLAMREKVYAIRGNMALEETLSKEQLESEYATQKVVNSLTSGSPKGVYSDVNSLKSSNPDTGVYLITNNGHIYSWTKNSSNNPVDLGVYMNVIDYDKALDELTILVKNFNYNKINLFDNLKFYSLKSIDNNDKNNVTVSNFNDKLIDFPYGDISKPFRIKLDNGTPIFSNWNFINLPTNSEAVFMYYFKKDGTYLTYKNLSNPDVNVIPSEAYYVSIIKFNNLTDYYIKLDTVNVEWLNSDVREELVNLVKRVDGIVQNVMETFTVDVNGTGDYTSLIECFNDLKDNTNNKIIKIMDGTYDIFEEIGGSEYAKSLTAEDKWNEVSTFIPDNTRIVGYGNVVLNFLPEKDDTNEYAAQYLSPINVQGNCEIENIKIYAKNCRYCIHDETNTQSKYDYGYRKYKGIECHYLKSDYGSGPGGQAYAAGFSSGMNYEYDNCIFDGQYRNQAFSMHNGNNSTKSNNIYIRNCIFKAPGSQAAIGFFNTATVQLLNNVYISNCHLNNQLLIANNCQGDTLVNAFKLYVNNCNNFSFDIKTAINSLEPEVYNTSGS